MGCCWNLLAGSPACLPQIYFNQLLSRYTRYKLMLAGFEKVHMPANGDAKSEISIPCEHEYAHGAHQLSIPAKLLTRGFCVCVRVRAGADADLHGVLLPTGEADGARSRRVLLLRVPRQRKRRLPTRKPR